MEPDNRAPDNGAEVARRFQLDLRELHLRAGKPSYSTLERIGRPDLKRATMSDILNASRVKLPDWRFVAKFVEACRAAAQENNLDPRELGSVAEWKQHWDGAAIGVLGARLPSAGYQPPTGPPAQVTVGPAAVPDADIPGVWGPVPPRLTDFVGREPWLARLRHGLASGSPGRLIAVQGLCGIGKTQLAVEYAYRHRGDYDLVWWISCGRDDDGVTAKRGLAELRRRLDLPDADMGQGRDDPFGFLRRGDPRRRWLLIFDGADEPDEIRDLIPPIRDEPDEIRDRIRPAARHVLVTTRNSRWDAIGSVLELGVLTREESIEFLHRRMRRFSPAQAHQVAEAVGDLPLLLEHAAESQVAVDEYLTRLHTDPLGLLDSQPSDYPAAIAVQWEESLGRLRTRNPAAFSLLTCMSFFGGAPIPREALERGSFLPDASIHLLLSDPVQRNRSIMMLRRAGLLRVDKEARTLDVHKVTRIVVRDMVVRDGTDSADRSRHDVHLLLAAADPLIPEDPANWRGYEQLREHVAESDAEGSAHPAVRRLVVNLARFLNVAGDPHAALRLADRALERWTAGTAAVPSASNDGCLAMRRARVDALFACRRYADAARFQQETLDLMRAAPGGWAEEMTLLGRMSGAYLRIQGKFGEALDADEASRREHWHRFGHDHPYSFAAASDVILDRGLCGEAAKAVEEASRAFGECQAYYDEAVQPAVLLQWNLLARCLWLNGQHREAASMMTDVHAGFRVLAETGVLDDNHLWRLAHDVDHAVIRRDSGASGSQLEAVEADLHQVRRRCWRTLGVDHPQTLAASVALASVLRRFPDRTDEATRLLADTAERYQAALPDHPFTHACADYLAVVRAGKPDIPDFTPLPL